MDMSEQTEVYFHGVWDAGGAGHYLYSPAGEARYAAARLPWPRHVLDGGLVWNASRSIDGLGRKPPTTPSIQGDAALRYKDGWTALAWHDFTGDRRGGSNSVVVARGTYTLAEMRALLERHFPAQHRRQDAQGLRLRHADPAPEAATPPADRPTTSSTPPAPET